MECMRGKFSEGALLDNRFLTLSPLNHGSFGMVSLARDIKTGELVAVKCLTKSSALSDENSPATDLAQELQYHSRLGSHRNIVNLLHSFETDSHFFIVLEYCSNGDLYEAIRLGRGPTETEHVREFMLQLVSAVEHMHARGVYHRDIKPENIFLTQDGSMKLGDFGLATAEQWSEESSVGSDRYMAPEQYDTPVGGYSAEKADIWAIGICLLNILFARNPFATPTLDDPLFADYVRDRESLFDVFPTLSYDTFQVLAHCLEIDPSKRNLSNVQEAIERVESWTIDDETYDDFCIDDREEIAVTANREPLRTPSIQTPAIAQGGCFPWAQALQMSQPQPIPAYHNQHCPEFTDERCPSAGEYARQMGFYVPPPSSYDSGLGESFSSISMSMTVKKSPDSGNTRSENINIDPPKKAFNFSSDVGEPFVSKSWSDWVLEDEEEEREREEAEKRRSWSYESVGVAEDFGDDDVEWIAGWEDDLNL